MQQKIVLMGSPGSGKSFLLNELMSRGYSCMPEVSREVTLAAQKKGIDQLFLADPLLFSNLLLEKREKQFLEASENGEAMVFFDRGIPDTQAYLHYLKVECPSHFTTKSQEHRYDTVFVLPPWEQIYVSDNERYESFEEAVSIYGYLQKTYAEIGYTMHIVPFGSVAERVDFVLHTLKTESFSTTRP